MSFIQHHMLRNLLWLFPLLPRANKNQVLSLIFILFLYSEMLSCLRDWKSVPTRACHHQIQLPKPGVQYVTVLPKKIKNKGSNILMIPSLLATCLIFLWTQGVAEFLKHSRYLGNIIWLNNSTTWRSHTAIPCYDGGDSKSPKDWSVLERSVTDTEEESVFPSPSLHAPTL